MTGTLAFNIFSNVASTDPGRCLVPDAVRSVRGGLSRGTFDRLRIRVFVDPNPHPEAFGAWADRIRTAAGDDTLSIHESGGLADGFRQSLFLSEGAVALQWEHDFVLLSGRVRHSASEIADFMERLSIDHLRFNKRTNRVAGYDHMMRPAGIPSFPVCRVTGRSNNPQFVDLAYYRERVAPLIDPAARKAAGLEGEICLRLGGGHVYGPLAHPPTVGHLDGRNVRRRDGLRRILWKLGLRG